MTGSHQTRPPAFAPMAELSRALRTGETSSVILTRECLRRIAAHDAVFKSFLAVYEEEALAAAALADEELRAGHDRGPLHGIPLALKDLVDIQGKPTTAGSPLLSAHIAQRDAAIVRRIAEAGGVIIGKTHMVQFALGAWGTNTHMDTPRNPAGRATDTLVAGGSSSGSAVAVAAHLVPWAIGSDTGGSVRVPAAFCGIVGFKPTIDALPREGVYPLSESLDSVGLIAASVQDARLCFEAFVGAPGSGLDARRRIGVLEADELAPLAPAVARCHAQSLQRLAQAGFSLVPFRFPVPLAAFKEPTNAIMIAEGASVNDRFLDDPDAPMDPSVRSRLLAARATTAVQYLQAQATASRWQQAFAGEMDRLGLCAIAMPVTAMTAPRLEDVDHNVAPVHFTRPVNLLALCGISLPAGEDDDARPIGLQLVGRAGGDHALLGVAAEVAGALHPSRNPPPEVRNA
ncbi:aspartyl-tRNA(Asn)/glutamyl-tRNA(Gln) amidotransferase subunit A [Variovorax beijingensis]|uniref:Aspartyl-tRNA(Asn)/glutamyl-tRNA(Gln) amidotransferase subunit A n=2 Tax=Variovorax TaxID=34072 RepID=A0AAE3XZB5_VARPD|nr:MULTISPECIES: amidase [Variovorax]MDP9964789.1 aspartyl-tRNA(Asn)/glutamyl-tRNA(Gln) amidotransferase subunit A [Variovorax paradoxus]MDR6427689.1 aspartyl-tRNA(Asn)/glutamyl-tRNA(Gln) amidotransferase subunit A [Variovorax paradoxus]MDR6454851.1 aspartyl-tRNA(Asn)/glutamyl-tRNA(Gln) amidotransferase subunit A [Variovorax paradoxus]TWD76426.1 aspartyl-tRNA(Asn)/glutamyl-tRNA(Gln) amidotransferase subunit A [Variovorax beijingensis]